MQKFLLKSNRNIYIYTSMKLNKKIDLSDFEFVSYNSCTFCNSSDVVKQDTIHKSPEVNYFFCNHCKVSYTDKQLSVKDTEKLYSHYYDEHVFKTGINPSVLGKHIFRFISSKVTVNSSVRILDYGGGDGSVAKYVAEELRKRKKCRYIIDVYDIYEIENKLDAVNYITSESILANYQYDIIIASAVIEHLNKPLDTLKMLFTSLKSNGYFYARTPFNLPLKNMCEKLHLKKKVDMQFPWHLFDMGRIFWNHIPVLFQSYHIKISVIKSQPSLIEIPFKNKKKRYIATVLLKFPGYIFKNWNNVGGWEVFIKKN